MYHITLIPGDGIGPEITDAAKRCIAATGVEINWEIVQAGASVMDEYGTPLPQHVLESIKRNKVALKGPITTPIGTGFRSVNVALRQSLDLYVCVRPCKSYPGVKSPYSNIDTVVIRENTEGLYAGIEFEQGSPDTRGLIEFVSQHAGATIRPDSGISIRPISRVATARITRAAFEYALRHGRKKVTVVHKANIMKYSDGLFQHTAEDIAREYKGRVEFEQRLVDNMCMQLVQKPELYDVLLLPNLYGDIISDLGAGLVGGLGMTPGANIGDEVAVFEPTHGSVPKYAGQNKSNPAAIILSGVLMLRHIGEMEAAGKLERAVAMVIQEGQEVTYDLKPRPDDPAAVGTSEMATAIIRKIESI
ncbi:MAG: isocitrate/isopropylmalate dehydrogenase family protein [Chloroflexota bacterium]|nr:isocitrate/isopropylmalate dehydrogenase family protein [Chloroflexota bacterium]